MLFFKPASRRVQDMSHTTARDVVRMKRTNGAAVRCLLVYSLSAHPICGPFLTFQALPLSGMT